MSDCIENRTFSEIEVGDSASVNHVLTTRDIQLFAVMSGDVNPAHLDEEYAKSDMFHGIIGHGMWSGALISTVLGTQLPGPGTIYLDQSLQFLRPVKVGDTITASVKVIEKLNDGKNHLRFACDCSNQDGKQVVVGEALVIAPIEKIKRKKVALPEVEFKEQAGRFFNELMTAAAQLEPLVTAIVHPVDGASLGGAVEAAEAGILTPILVGPEHKIRAVAEQEGLDISPYKLIATEHSHEAAEIAVSLAARGEVEALMKGKLHTDELMAAIVSKTEGLRTGRRMSHVFALDIPTYHKPLFLTDAAINIKPNLSVKTDIVQNAIDLFLALGRGVPKVALVSAVETVNEAIPSTLDATALCKMAERGQITGGLLDGPLGFDNAISKEAAAAKGIVSQVAGDADIIVAPDLESGNMLYKQLGYLFGIDGAGIVLGARVPVILTSRAAGRGPTRMASCALGLIYARSKKS
ncbi:bifunctional enoyl-CoA hydratase/phosphate acetyltransferase [Halioxenophilus sp. WMMB6]|uniref:bifunctional enoyl-CoA hydratase/phosphate acetyltransferase n=1 Tax=Halioxenophilus sp. WMMB6 TaxID=3073815 RepID=UPI00295E8659|nr:bifunctional enoyl-CoA hydratase/phosphate acetyltransferase [Halioxenophilus sp. WMMB6]